MLSLPTRRPIPTPPYYEGTCPRLTGSRCLPLCASRLQAPCPPPPLHEGPRPRVSRLHRTIAYRRAPFVCRISGGGGARACPRLDLASRTPPLLGRRMPTPIFQLGSRSQSTEYRCLPLQTFHLLQVAPPFSEGPMPSPLILPSRGLVFLEETSPSYVHRCTLIPHRRGAKNTYTYPHMCPFSPPQRDPRTLYIYIYIRMRPSPTPEGEPRPHTHIRPLLPSRVSSELIHLRVSSSPSPLDGPRTHIHRYMCPLRQSREKT